MTIREAALKEVVGLVCGERERQYGNPRQSFETIGKLFGMYQDRREGPVSAYDAAFQMALLKIARLMNGYHRDSALDAMGYLALAIEMAEGEAPSVVLQED